MTRIPFDEMKATIKSAFLNAGMPEGKAETCAQIHTESSRDGVYSHGLNRVERFVDYISKGWVDVNAEPTLELNLGSMETYKGNLGPGILNAIFAMNRATEIAAKNGLGLVSLNNTTHWMRGGAYGWQAAEKGFIGICWTNTESCMPAWGAKSCGIGNNPFIMAVPGKDGHVVLDMAMSQYSYGKLQTNPPERSENSPILGGFDQEGNLTDNPGEIEETRRIFTHGFLERFRICCYARPDFCIAFRRTYHRLELIKPRKAAVAAVARFLSQSITRKINTQEFIDQALHETIEQLKSSVPATENGEIFLSGRAIVKNRGTKIWSWAFRLKMVYGRK